MDKTLVFATANPHKLLEVQAMMPEGVLLRSLSDIGFSGNIPETEPSLEGNALMKARYISERYQLSCFADDTGLETEALGGAPGVYSARYSGIQGTPEEISEANMAKLLHELSGADNRKARFRTVIACIDDAGSEFLFEGIVNGLIVETPRGNKGFGYDPVFMPDGYAITFAQMPLPVKNQISHRARAFQKFAQWLMRR
ncbi:MAG: RdgB/HAM1 family non-canonical purine NTP pyrophosphatase [Bacteroidales bacterium]|nr:RdgB/HAM1 family non-canonical purine NTP pyrophosphatase [Bacteroidales bacterium]